jgi:hypothetical protein
MRRCKMHTVQAFGGGELQPLHLALCYGLKCVLNCMLVVPPAG